MPAAVRHPLDPLTAEEIRAAVADSELSWTQDPRVPRTTLHLCVEDPPGAVELVLSADERYFPPAEQEALARAIEQAAVQAAIAPRTPTGIAHPVMT